MGTPATLRFFCGDDVGHLKSVVCSQTDAKWDISANTIPDVGSSSGIQKLAILREDESSLLAIARADGSISLLRTSFDADVPIVSTILETKEGRMRPPQTFVGLALRDTGLYTCTSSGHLRLTRLPSNLPSGPDAEPSHSLGSLPTRLRDMRLSPSGKTLAYGGDEVALSMWDTERAFARSGASEDPTNANANANGSGKRKKSAQLFPGEIWRARNDPNDALSLREPIQITALSYLSHPSSHASHPASQSAESTLLSGNQDGSVRLYDTRHGRRAAAHWLTLSPSSGALRGPVRVLDPGPAEHQLFVGDAAGNLLSLDTRTGRVMYAYKGISGALSALAAVLPSTTPTPTHARTTLLASVARDRLFRLHSAPEPQADQRQNQGRRGEVLASAYVPSVPTAVVFAGAGAGVGEEMGSGEVGDEEREGEELWEEMAEVGEGEDDDEEEDEDEEDSEEHSRKRPRT